MSGEVINAIKGVKGDDIIIAFMGPTGSGKSCFIDLLTGEEGRRAGGSLKSVTSQVQATRVKHPRYRDRVVLVDTPGFDDTTLSDMQILQMIGDWLEKTYQKGVKLAGIVYLHRITDNRMAGSPYKNLRMFGELCGDVATHKVMLVSTMWQLIKRESGLEREKELQEKFWAPLIEKGSQCRRLENRSADAAWQVVNKLIDATEKRDAVLLQEELVDLGMKLNETQAGKTLYTTLQKLLSDQKDNLKLLMEQVEKTDDPKLKKELKKEYGKIEQQFQKTFNEVKGLKIPLSKRILAIFFGKKAHAKSIKVSGTSR